MPIHRSDKRAEKYLERMRTFEWRYTWRSEIDAESKEEENSGKSVKRRRMTSAVEASLKKKTVSQVVVLGETRWWFWVRGVSTNEELSGVAVEEWRGVAVRGLFLGMPAVGIISGK